MNKLLFSTKGLYTNTFVPLIIYFVASGCFFFTYPKALTTPIGYIGSLAVMLVFIKPFTDSVQLKKSYVELHSDYLTGKSISENNMLNSNAPSTFYLRYEDILNVEIQDKKVKIYFNGGSYIVQAYKVEARVLQIIQTQKEHILSQKNAI